MWQMVTRLDNAALIGSRQNPIIRKSNTILKAFITLVIKIHNIFIKAGVLKLFCM